MGTTYYETLGRMHAALARRLDGAGATAREATHPARSLARRLRDERGQGTVEYVGLILLIAVIVGGVVGVTKVQQTHGIPDKMIEVIKGGIDKAVKNGN